MTHAKLILLTTGLTLAGCGPGSAGGSTSVGESTGEGPTSDTDTGTVTGDGDGDGDGDGTGDGDGDGDSGDGDGDGDGDSAIPCAESLDPSWDPIWMKCIVSPHSSASDVVASPSDDIFVVGRHSPWPACAGASSWAHSYDAQGTERWRLDHGCVDGVDDALSQLTLAGTQVVAVGSRDVNAVEIKALVRIHSQDGVEAAPLLVGDDGLQTWFEAVTGNPDGSFVAVGATTGDPNPARITSFSSTGEIAWDRQLVFTGHARSLAVISDAAGNVTAAGRATDIMWLAKYDPLGELLWSRSVPLSTFAVALTIGPSGEPLVAVSSEAADSNTELWQLDAAGELVWSEAIDPSPGQRVRAIALDSSADILVLTDVDADTPDIQLTKLRLDGGLQPIWSKRFDAGDFDSGGGVAVLSDDRVIVTGALVLEPGGYATSFIAAFEG